jgi:hypothetical protein
MAIEFTTNGYPVWRKGFTPEERREYRRLKHRHHAARSRRLRGKEVPRRGKRGERQEYVSETANHPTPIDAYPSLTFPAVGDYDGDGIPE